MLRRTLQELVPPTELGELLSRLQAFPKVQPELGIIEVDAPLPDPDYLEVHFFFTPLRPKGEVVTAWYDYPERELTDYGFGRVLGEVEVADWPCYEVIDAGSPTDEPGSYSLSYWSVAETAVHWIARYRSDEDRLRLRTDADWGDLTEPWPRYPGRQPLVERVGDEEFVDRERRLLAPVGAYDVRVGARARRCVRLIQPPLRGDLVETYVNEAGRTVLFRRYNAAPEWSRERVKGPYQTTGAVERLKELGNRRLVYNGVEFYHWYDCLTDVALTGR